MQSQATIEQEAEYLRQYIEKDKARLKQPEFNADALVYTKKIRKQYQRISKSIHYSQLRLNALMWVLNKAA